MKSYRYSRAKIQIERKFQMFLCIAELSLQMRFCKRNASKDIYSSSRTSGLSYNYEVGILLLHHHVIFHFLSIMQKTAIDSALSEDVSIHRTNLKYCGKSLKIRLHSYFHIL